MKKLLILFILFLTFSCLEKKTKEQTPVTANTLNEKKIDVLDGKFRVIFEGVFENDDLFLLFFTDKEGEKLSNKKVFKKEITGDKTSQKIVFAFPENVFPFLLRFDFSDKKDQKQVIFKSIQIIDKFNKVVIDNSNLEDFFAFNNHMEYDKENGVLFGTIFKLNEKDAYNPYFVSNNKFSKVLKEFHDASKNEFKKQLINDLVNTNLIDGRYRILINGLFEKDDLVLLYYAENTTQRFDLKYSLRQNVNGSKSYQKVLFTLPKGTYASKIQLDISDKKTQSKVEIKDISIIEGKSIFTITKKELSKYFYPNNYIDLDTLTGDFKCKTIIENNIEKYNPYFVSTPKMVKTLINF